MSDEAPEMADFGRDELVILALAGTVTLPSPFPAAGKVYLGLLASGQSFGLGDRTPFYLKLVQAIGEKKSITRFVRLGDIRAVRVYETSTNPDNPGSWSLRTAEEINGTLTDFREMLMKANQSNSSSSHEVLLFPEAILYLPEAAPVLVRLEYGLTAAEACHLESAKHLAPHCC